MTEIWKQWDDKYEASNYGNVRHVKHKKILKYSYPPNGSPQVNLNSHTINVSRIIATLFLGERPEGYDIHHKDHNPSNNHIENLDYVPMYVHRSNHHQKHEPKHCLTCGKKIQHHCSYCSGFCREKNIYEIRSCKVCGKKFKIRKKYIAFRATDKRYKNGVGIYCSKQCKSKDLSTNLLKYARLTGEERKNYRRSLSAQAVAI